MYRDIPVENNSEGTMDLESSFLGLSGGTSIVSTTTESTNVPMTNRHSADKETVLGVKSDTFFLKSEVPVAFLGLSGGTSIGSTTTESTNAPMTKRYSADKETAPFLLAENEVKSDTLFLKSKAPAALKIIRIHFTKKILKVLHWLSENHEKNSVDSSLHITALLNDLLMLFHKNHEDPFSSLAIAMYDGLSKDDGWIELDRSDYEIIKTQFKTLANRDIKDYTPIDKAIANIEDRTGLDTTPY